MRLSRAERSLLVDWWFTVDRALLAAILFILGAGMLLSSAESPSIALKRGLPTFYYVERHASLPWRAPPSCLRYRCCLPQRCADFLSSCWSFMCLDGARPHDGCGDLAHAQAASGGLSVAALGVCQAGVRGAVRVAAGGRRATTGHAGCADGGVFVPHLRKPACNATGRRAGAVGEPRMGALFLLAGRPLRWFFMLAAGLAGGLLAAYLSVSHVRSRVVRFLHPTIGDTFRPIVLSTRSSKVVFLEGSGEGTIKTVLPDAHTDFIFAVIPRSIECSPVLCCWRLP